MHRALTDIPFYFFHSLGGEGKQKLGTILRK
jgi:hypothetical protein